MQPAHPGLQYIQSPVTDALLREEKGRNPGRKSSVRIHRSHIEVSPAAPGRELLESPKAGRGKERSSHRAFARSLGSLPLKLPVSRTVSRYFSVVYSHPGYGSLLGQNCENNTLNISPVPRGWKLIRPHTNCLTKNYP